MKKISSLLLTILIFLTCTLCFIGCKQSASFQEPPPIMVDDRTMVDCSQFYYVHPMSSVGYPIVLNHENASTVFECTVETGVLNSSTTKFVKSLTVAPSEGIWWRPEGVATEIEHTFIEVVLKTENNAIGYAVIKISQIKQLTFVAETLKAEISSQKNGIYQTLTEEQIAKKIKEAKVNM